MKKKTISFRLFLTLLAFSMMFAFSACGKREENAAPKGETAAIDLTAATPEEIAQAYMQAEKDGDIEKIYSLVPGEVTAYLINNIYGGDKEQLLNEFNEQCLAKYLENGGVPAEECGFEFVSADDEDSEILEETKQVFAEDGIAEISAVKDVTFKFWVQDDVQEGFIVQLVQIGDKWGVLPFYVADILVGE